MKNKTLAILLCAVMVLSLGACGKTNNDAKSNKVSGTSTTESTESTEQVKDIKYNASDYVTLGDYKNITVSLDKTYEVTDKDISDYVNDNVIASYPYYVDSTKTTVENGDVANIDYEGLVDGKDFSGGSAKSYDLQIGSNSFITGFETGLIGATVGKEVDLNLTFPTDYSQKDLAGKAVVFKVTVNSIKQKQDMSYDTLTDDYVKYLSTKVGASYATVDDLKKDVTSYIQQQNETDKQKALRTATISKLQEACPVKKLPDGLLEQQISQYLAQFKQKIPKGTTMDAYLQKNYNIKEDAFKKQINTEMKDQVKTQLILEAIAKAEKLKFDKAGFEKYVTNMKSSYGYKKDSQLYKSYGSTSASGKTYLEKVYVCNKALSKVMDTEKVDTQAAASTQATTESTTQATTTGK